MVGSAVQPKLVELLNKNNQLQLDNDFSNEYQTGKLFSFISVNNNLILLTAYQIIKNFMKFNLTLILSFKGNGLDKDLDY